MAYFNRDDLKGMISNRISVDEFNPKSGTTQEVIVIGIFSAEIEAVQELNTFIQRGSFEIIDTEVSPNPGLDGNYAVFIEFKRTHIFVSEFRKFLSDIENLTGKLKWEADIYTHESVIDPYSEDFDAAIVTDVNFFNASDSDVSIKEGCVVFGNRVVGSLLGVGDVELLKRYDLNEKRINVMSPDIEVRALSGILGEHYDVVSYGTKCAIFNYKQDRVAVLSGLYLK